MDTIPVAMTIANDAGWRPAMAVFDDPWDALVDMRLSVKLEEMPEQSGVK